MDCYTSVMYMTVKGVTKIHFFLKMFFTNLVPGCKVCSHHKKDFQGKRLVDIDRINQEDLEFWEDHLYHHVFPFLCLITIFYIESSSVHFCNIILKTKQKY